MRNLLSKRFATKSVDEFHFIAAKYLKVDVNVCKVISDTEGGQLSGEKLICHACYKQASRNIDNIFSHDGSQKLLQQGNCV